MRRMRRLDRSLPLFSYLLNIFGHDLYCFCSFLWLYSLVNALMFGWNVWLSLAIIYYITQLKLMFGWPIFFLLKGYSILMSCFFFYDSVVSADIWRTISCDGFSLLFPKKKIFSRKITHTLWSRIWLARTRIMLTRKNADNMAYGDNNFAKHFPPSQ